MSKPIAAKQVKELRDQTGAAMMEAKSALLEARGDTEKAIEILRKKGVLQASKKSDRLTGAGMIDTYVHDGGRIGVMVEVNCETDFVARNEEFRSLVHDLALHIAAASPWYVGREDIPAELIKKEQEIFQEEAKTQNKPAVVLEKIVAGRMEKFYEEICLLDQSFVRNQDITVRELVQQKIAVFGENIRVKRFARYVLGE